MRRNDILVPLLLSLAFCVTGAQALRIWVDSVASYAATSDAGTSSTPIVTAPSSAPDAGSLAPDRRADPSRGIERRDGSYPDFLPPEAHEVLVAIDRGGPFRYDKDGSIFQNREGLLPRRARGYYHEYTVDTPGSSDRGARRIVTGGEPPSEYFYTDDHYESFRPFEHRAEGAR